MANVNPDRIMQEFAARTRKNILHIKTGKERFRHDVFEVTEVFNSLLSLIVLPEALKLDPPLNTALERLSRDRWPEAIINLSPPFPSLGVFLYCMRHSIAHGDFAFRPGRDGEIASVEFGGSCRLPRNPTEWLLELTVDDLFMFVFALCDMWVNFCENTTFKR
ncbi:HEPN family nuclease [Humidesulfovibrio sp.]|uniref:HEPN family nuclease n=1 Tax=Humidesulfovibrio sp. TaxID=2910988 RepID=UPI002D7EFFA7|nr:HEPN family nuclease [Humidesulfovibrio sp.]